MDNQCIPVCCFNVKGKRIFVLNVMESNGDKKGKKFVSVNHTTCPIALNRMLFLTSLGDDTNVCSMWIDV